MIRRISTNLSLLKSELCSFLCLTIPGGTSFVDHLCYLCFVFVMLSHLFIAA